MMAKLRLAPLALPILLALALMAGPAAAQRVPPLPGMDAPAPSPLKPGDAFGEQVTLPERTIIYLQGHSKWDSALDTLVDAFKSLNEYLDKHGIKANGPAMTIYTQTDDSGFAFRAAVPVAQAPENPPKGDIAVGQAPSGKALKFVHRGSYDAMDSTYEAITNYLDDKGIEAKDVFVEEYTGGPLKADDDNLQVTVFVPVK
jgi:effector-binding domain-containing protein